MKRSRPDDEEEARSQRRALPEGPLATLDEFWKDMLMPWLPLFMRLRCRRLSRRHCTLLAEEPWPPWVSQERMRLAPNVMRNLIEFGIACGFPSVRPAREVTDRGALTACFSWEERYGADDSNHLILAIDFERHVLQRHRVSPGVTTTSQERLPFGEDPRPAVQALRDSPASAREIDRRIKKIQAKSLEAAGVHVTFI